MLQSFSKTVSVVQLLPSESIALPSVPTHVHYSELVVRIGQQYFLSRGQGATLDDPASNHLKIPFKVSVNYIKSFSKLHQKIQ